MNTPSTSSSSYLEGSAHSDPQAGWFPVSLRLAGARVLLVGGGEIAVNKGRLLLDHGARIDVLAEALHPVVQGWVESGRVRHVAGRADESALKEHLPGCRLVYAATDDRDVNRQVAALADALNIPVCAVDDPQPSSFITPAQVRRGAVRVAVSTGGAAPVLARRLREQIEALLPEGTGRLAAYMQSRRSQVSERYPQVQDRKRIWEDFLDGPGAEEARNGDDVRADVRLNALLDADRKPGEVWLVGAGPGDPDLLTLKALRLMQNADCVLYDNLLSPALLDMVRRDAELVFVGKQRDRHALPQDDINREMIRRAQAGERVLRLKGGDPFIFGRGGEEIEALVEAGVAFRLVPGISAANGCAAYSGIPLTHRDCAQACLFVTGHAKADGVLDLPWEDMADRRQTVVIYMGISTLSQLAAGLLGKGLPADWPVAIVERGTQPSQRVLTGTLSNIALQAAEAQVKSPALVIVGQVVRHRVISP
ncbi:siroheme synthase CysG [Gluconobacter kondonii]|uniref:siroheme synthase CysG n=1 Tax=Gluconobacter kondonii TaxID=941463 RepID=UPI001B8B747C|nr:siroheme synthase CysG [Gluconobacter kondonii]MBS1054078.1 uroporphyrinogen-III C-methyltransferase [Gluconobacter kondonii]MBS1055190.1 uroporphyrinogen-III C-methyltransferase [Gluconobacter kondonii]